jgi:hypothetical protein
MGRRRRRRHQRRSRQRRSSRYDFMSPMSPSSSPTSSLSTSSSSSSSQTTGAASEADVGRALPQRRRCIVAALLGDRTGQRHVLLIVPIRFVLQQRCESSTTAPQMKYSVSPCTWAVWNRSVRSIVLRTCACMLSCYRMYQASSRALI